VRAVGKLLAIDEQSVQMQLAGEGAPVTVLCHDATRKFMVESVGKGCYEVVGTLQTDGAIKEMNTTFFGDNFDMGMYAEMAKLTHAFPDIF